MFTTSGNHGKLTALRCPIAVCSLLLCLIQRFIVLCKTILPHFINPIILWVVLHFTYTVLPYRAMAVLKLAVSILLVSFDSIREILWSRLYDLNCGLILETICSYLNHSDSYIAIPQADVDFIFFELPQARPSDIWCSVFTISPPMFQHLVHTWT